MEKDKGVRALTINLYQSKQQRERQEKEDHGSRTEKHYCRKDRNSQLTAKSNEVSIVQTEILNFLKTFSSAGGQKPRDSSLMKTT